MRLSCAQLVVLYTWPKEMARGAICNERYDILINCRANVFQVTLQVSLIGIVTLTSTPSAYTRQKEELATPHTGAYSQPKEAERVLRKLGLEPASATSRLATQPAKRN